MGISFNNCTLTYNRPLPVVTGRCLGNVLRITWSQLHPILCVVQSKQMENQNLDPINTDI